MGDVFVYQPVLVGGVFGHVMPLDQSRRANIFDGL